MPRDPLSLVTARVSAAFGVIRAEDTTIETADALRLRLGGEAAIGILYDVSPPKSAQELVDDLARFPSIALCDHHGGAAPLKEVRGLELTGAEVLVRDLGRMTSAGLFSSPVTIVGMTNTMNIDPDSLVCRYLIESFADPEARNAAWTPENLELLIKVARFGDTTFFGGLHIPALEYDTLEPHVKIAFAILQLINKEKAELVIRSKTHEAFLAAAIKLVAGDRIAADPRLSTTAAVLSVIRELKRSPAAPMDTLASILGERMPTPDRLRSELETSGRASGLAGEALAEHVDAGIERFVFRNLSRSRVKEVFLGKKVNDLFGSAHPPRFDEAAIDQLFRGVTARMPLLVSRPDAFRPYVERFVSDLKHVHELGKKHTTTEIDPADPKREVSVTVIRERMDREPAKLQSGQRHPIWDWLREACAAFGEPWLHVMDRGRSLVVSARFAAPGETRPEIDLSRPEVVARLLALEEQAARKAGAEPVQFLVKANLWLPTGRPHFSGRDVVKLLLDSYDLLVTPADPANKPSHATFQECSYPSGKGPFDGSRALIEAFVASAGGGAL